MAFRWRADDGPTLDAGLVAAIFQGIRTCFARKPYIFVVFHTGGDPDPLSPLLDPPMLKLKRQPAEIRIPVMDAHGANVNVKLTW